MKKNKIYTEDNFNYSDRMIIGNYTIEMEYCEDEKHFFYDVNKEWYDTLNNCINEVIRLNSLK